MDTIFVLYRQRFNKIVSVNKNVICNTYFGKMPVAGQQILGNSWGNAGQMANKRPHLVPISDRKIEQQR